MIALQGVQEFKHCAKNNFESCILCTLLTKMQDYLRVKSFRIRW